jgi:PAS domain S-box-containing protein
VETGAPTIAELRARIDELERDRELLNAIANVAPSLICLVDAEGRVRPYATNRAFERTLGYEPGETGGVLFWERYVPREEADAVRDAVEAVVRTGTPAALDGRWVTRDGRHVEVAWTCTPMPMIESGPLYLLTAADVTERRRHEEEVRRSRERIVAAADEARKRLERNLHDGAQQRLIALLLTLRMAATRSREDPALGPLLASAVEELGAAVVELRELARGIHPAVLTEQGLPVAIRIVADRAPLPVEVVLPTRRYRAAIEAAAYYTVSEALANVARYAGASAAAVRVNEEDGILVVEVEDDGAGGASLAAGTGLRGLADRIAAVDGTFSIDSPQGHGTRIRAEIPLDERD